MIIKNCIDPIQGPRRRDKLNLKQNINFCGAEKIKLRDSYLKEFKNSVIVKDFDKVIGSIIAGIAVGGLGVGGTGLIYDYTVKKEK